MGQKQFLDVYLEFDEVCRLKSYIQLNEAERAKLGRLLDQAHKIYVDITQRRAIGNDYINAALSYFASGNTSQHIEERYLVLRVSYFFYKQYQDIAKLHNSKNKQKESLDLLRYIAKPLFEEPQQKYVNEARALLDFYLNFMLTHYAKQAMPKYQAWKKAIQELVLKNEKIVSYSGTLMILLRRLAQGKVVHRKRRKNKKIVKDWPSKARVKQYRERKRHQRVYLDDAIDIAATYDVNYDEYGEIEIEEAGFSLHSMDQRTARFHAVLNEHTDYLHRHRQRRLQPFITNPVYMSADVIQQLTYLLTFELNHAHATEAAIAAACLLSLSTGLSPIELLQYSQLIEDGILVVNNDVKRPKYCLRINLNISQQKIEHLKLHQLNQTQSYDLYLSSSWFDYLHHHNQASNISIGDINRYLKKCTLKEQMGSITVEKLQAQLYFHVFHQTFNEYIAHILSGKDSYHDLPSSFYGGVEKKKLNHNYLIYLETLNVPAVNSEIEQLNRQVNQVQTDSDYRFGSQRALTPNYVQTFFQQLHSICFKKAQIEQHIIEQINAHAIWMWHIYLLSLAGRPKENLLGELQDYDIKLKLIYINDKKNSQSRKDGRFIPLPDFFTQAFERYIDFLEQITTRYKHLLKWVFNKNITVNDFFGKIIIYPKDLPTTAGDWASKKIKISALNRQYVNAYLKQHLDIEIYNNWLRHFDMNMLMNKDIAFNVIQALYGHDQRNRELLYRYSSASLHEYMRVVTHGIDEMIKKLQIKHIC